MTAWAILTLIVTAAPAASQTRARQDEVEDQPLPLSQETRDPVTPGRTASSAIGEVGQRQTQSQIAPDAQPLARVDGRIQNRVQNRIRNRIDRYYDPQANATSPFTVAADQARTGSRLR